MTDTSMEQTILETAERLFLVKGFGLTSTNDIAREVGCNQSLINYYFRSKEKLFQTIFEKKLILFLAGFMEPLKSDLPFLEKIRHLSEGHYENLSKNPQLPLFILNEIRTNPERLEAFKDIIQKSLAKIVPSLQKELTVEIQEGRVRNTTLFDILLTMASLNIGSILFPPLLNHLLQSNDTDRESERKERGKENARILLLSLSPQDIS